jgi:hypothetical protein
MSEAKSGSTSGDYVCLEARIGGVELESEIALAGDDHQARRNFRHEVARAVIQIVAMANSQRECLPRNSIHVKATFRGVRPKRLL